MKDENSYILNDHVLYFIAPYKLLVQFTTCKFCFSTINPQLNLLRFNCSCGESLVKDIMTQIPS